ncbi:MAG: response regulator [Lachnospiraceae bacterium]|nr:response regulator [Lachnospiraceae bacterium]
MDFGNFSLTKETLPIARQMAEQIPGGFVIYQENENRDIIYVNSKMLEIYKCSTLEEFKEHTGYTFPGMVHPDDFQRVQVSIDAQIGGKHGEHDHVEYRIITKDGSVRWLDDYGHFSHSKDYGDLYYVFLIDITEKRLAQEARNKFFFKMSHELINPLNVVSSFIKLAVKHRDDPALLEEYLNNANEATDDMVRLIDNIMEIHRLSAADDGFEPLNAEEVFKNEKPGRVLIVEDNELNQVLLKTILDEYGFEVETADDGGPAVDAVKDHPEGYYDVILMDIQMVKMDGFEAAERIRRLPHADKDSLPIIAISANARSEDIERSKASGMNEHLAKPYDPEQIVETIIKYKKRSRI